MSDTTTWVGWFWKWPVGWCELTSADNYATCYDQLRARHPEANARLTVLPEGEVPRPVQPTRPASGR